VHSDGTGGGGAAAPRENPGAESGEGHAKDSAQATRAGRVDRILAGLTLATLPLGSIAYESEGRSLLIAYSLLVGSLLVVHVLAGTLARRAQRGPLGRAFRVAAVMLLAMAVPVLADGIQLRALVAYVSFAGGTLCGLAIAAVWSTARSRLGFVDACFVLFVVLTLVQVRLSGSDDPGVTLHQAEVTWGASNYVAGTLVVASLAVVARLLEVRTHRWLWVVPVLGYASALLTLSRGAAVSGAVGLLVLLWNSGRTTMARAALRLSCVGLVVVAAEVFTAITEARSIGGYDPGQNVDARIALLQIAWDQFLSSPLTGTGWLALRDVSAFAVPISFAHNVVLSFLQIGGVFGAIFLVVLGRQVVAGLRHRTPMFAAVAAALAMSFSDPFLEGGVGSLIAWSAIGYAAFTSGDSTQRSALGYERRPQAARGSAAAAAARAAARSSRSRDRVRSVR
jgi:hypothetical protein